MVSRAKKVAASILRPGLRGSRMVGSMLALTERRPHLFTGSDNNDCPNSPCASGSFTMFRLIRTALGMSLSCS